MDRPEETPEETRETETGGGPLFSVVAGEGDGFLLGLAAGDTAGGAWDLGYSAVTEQATIISYQLIEHRQLNPDGLVPGLVELDGIDEEEPVYRAETAQFRFWLDSTREGADPRTDQTCLDSAARCAPVGVAYRRDPGRVISEAAALGRLFHRDAASVAAGVISAAAVAASCFAQSGLDLIAGVSEAVVPHVGEIGEGLSGQDRLEGMGDEMSSLLGHVGLLDGPRALELVGGDATDPIQMVLAGLLLAAPPVTPQHQAIEQAARIGGSLLGAVVGALVGARVGIRAWPWAFANDTWFAEIGRRLVRGPDQVIDLPIPYAVEQHLISGARPGFH